MKHVIAAILALMLALGTGAASAQGNLEVNTPAIAAIKSAMQSRHGALVPHYKSGAVGLTAKGTLAVRDAKAVPLSQRAKVNTLVAAENADRMKLYREIAQANGHPEWAAKVQQTFAKRWIDKAPSGWYVQQGGWKRK